MSLTLLKQLGSEVDRLDRKVAGFADRFGQLESTLGSQVERVAAAVDQAATSTEERLDQLFDRGDGRLEQLLEAMGQFDESPQRAAIEQALQSLAEGNATLEEVNRRYGQVSVTIDGLETKLSQVFVRMDPRRGQEAAQELRRLIEQEIFGVEEILQVLDRSVDGWAKRLADFVRSGKASIEDLIREADKAFEARGPDSIAGVAAEGLAELFRRGEADF